MANLRWDGDDFRNSQDSSGSTVGLISRAGELQQGYNHGSLTQGLVAYYPMGSGSGSTLEDKTELANNGTLKPGSSGTTTTSGMWSSDSKVGDYCLKFDGEDDYVDITDETLRISNRESLTVSAWVKIQDNADEYRMFVSIGGENDGTPRTHLAKARSGWNEGRMYFQVVNSSSRTDLLSNDTGSQLPKDQWLHLVGVVDQKLGRMRFYINGDLKDEGPTVDYNLSNADNFEVNLGKSANNDAHVHNSVIDEIRIYKRPLSTPEVRALYSFSSPSKISPADTLH